jgi:hypothetical protein
MARPVNKSIPKPQMPMPPTPNRARSKTISVPIPATPMATKHNIAKPWHSFDKALSMFASQRRDSPLILCCSDHESRYLSSPATAKKRE